MSILNTIANIITKPFIYFIDKIGTNDSNIKKESVDSRALGTLKTFGQTLRGMYTGSKKMPVPLGVNPKFGGKRKMKNKTNKKKKGGEGTPNQTGTFGFRNSFLPKDCKELNVDDFLKKSTIEEAKITYDNCCNRKRNYAIPIPKCTYFLEKLNNKMENYKEKSLVDYRGVLV
jgi:hypothetical protein